MSQTFPVARWGATAVVWTVGFFAGLLYFGGRAVLELINGAVPDPLDGGAGIVLILLIAYAWLRSVKAYSVGDGALTIVRAGPGRVHIDAENIESIEARPNIGAFFNNGMLSVGGVFGWAGKASFRKPRDIRSTQAEIYGTNPTNAVMLELSGGRTIIVTPADPHGLVEAVRSQGVRPPKKPVGAGKKRARK